MSRMLKALSRIDENKAEQKDELPPLSAAELAELNAKSCQGAGGGQHPLSKTMVMPAEESLQRAEALLDAIEKSAPTVGDANRATLMVADLALRPTAAEADSLESFRQTVAVQFAEADIWSGVALPPPGDVDVELVEPAGFDVPRRQAPALTCDVVATPLDLGASYQVQVVGDQQWRVTSRIDPAPADTIVLVESTTWEEKLARHRRRDATDDAAAKTLKSPSDAGDSSHSKKWPIEIQGANAGISRSATIRVGKTAGQAGSGTKTVPRLAKPLEISPKIRRQCEEFVAGLLRKLPETESAVLLFTAVDGNTPSAPVLGPLANVLATAGAGPVLLTDARFAFPALGDLFIGDGSPALAAYLRGEADWQQLPIAAAGEGLDYVPGGDWQAAGGRLVGNGAADRWAELKARYRFVLIDADGLDKPAARQLVAASDGVYLLATLERSGVSATEQKAAVIRTAGGRVEGCVLVYSPIAD